MIEISEGVMKKALVMYSSKYGTTKKYAEWIAEEIKGDIFDIKDVRQCKLYDYDIIVLGSGLYAGKIKGINLLVNDYNKIKDKKLVVFTCGLADYTNMKNVNNIKMRLQKIIPNNIFENIKIFYLQGGINYKNLNIKHKIMMGMLRKMVLRKGFDKMNDEDKEFLETYGQTLDFTEKSKVKEIINFCNNN